MEHMESTWVAGDACDVVEDRTERHSGPFERLERTGEARGALTNIVDMVVD